MVSVSGTYKPLIKPGYISMSHDDFMTTLVSIVTIIQVELMRVFWAVKGIPEKGVALPGQYDLLFSMPKMR